MLRLKLISVVLCLSISPSTNSLAQESLPSNLSSSGAPSSNKPGSTPLTDRETTDRETVVRLLISLPEKYLGCPKLTLEQLKGSSEELEVDFVNLYFFRRPDPSGKCKAAIALFKQTLGTPYTLAVQNLTGGFRGLPTFLEFRRNRWLDVTKRVLPSFVLRLERPKIKSRLARDGSGLLVAHFDETDNFSKPLYTLEWKRGQFWPLEMKARPQVSSP